MRDFKENSPEKEPKIKAWIDLPSFTPWLVLILSLFATFIGWYIIRENQVSQEKARFEAEVFEHVLAIKHRMESYEQVLLAGVAFVDASNTVDRGEWRTFANNLHVQGLFPGTLGYGYAIFVPHEKVVAHEALMQAEGFPGYRIHPIDENLTPSAIIFLEPLNDRNKKAIGYNMFKEPNRLAAMTRAIETGNAALSGRVTLVQENKGPVQAGTLMYLPVYQKGALLKTVEDRRAAIIGFVYAPLRMGDLMQGVLGKYEHFIDLHIFDGESTAEADLMYDSDGIIVHDKTPEFHQQKVVEISGRKWNLVFKNSENFTATVDTSKQWLIAIGGILVSLLLFGFVRELALLQNRAVALARQMTSDLLASESQANAVLETALDGIITISEQGLIQSFNPAAETLFGYPTDEVLGQNVNMLMPEPYSSNHDGYLFNFLNTGHRKIIGSGREVIGRRKDGSTFPMKLAVSQDKANQRFVGIVSDITAEKTADAQKELFVSTVSHELRTPITAISGMLKLLLGVFASQLPPKAIEMLQKADNNCNRLIRLINDILDMEKIAAGKMPFHMKVYDLVKLTQQAIEDNQGYADKAGITLMFQKTLPERAFAVIDSDRFAQLMANLISNAVKFSPKDQPVEISLSVLGGDIRIGVQDHGPGIPEDFHDKIFQRFAQADKGDTRKPGGTGLGLAICQMIVEKFAGKINFQTAMAVGTTFFVTLPATESSADPLA